MDNYRSKSLEFYKIIDELRASRHLVLDREAHQPTIQKQLKIAGDTALKKLNVLKRELAELADIEKQKAAIAFDRARRQGEDAARVSYVQTNAVNAFEGITGDELIEKYSAYVKNLHPDDQPYRWVVDDLVRARARDQGTAEMLEHVITKNYSVEEKVAEAGLSRMQILDNTHSTLTGLMEMMVESVAKGEKPAAHDIADTYDDLMQGPTVEA